MRLGIYIPFVDDRPGGLGVYIREVCSRLFREFPDHVLFTMQSSNVPNEWNVKQIFNFEAPPENCSEKRRHIHRFALLNYELPRALKKTGCDAVFIPYHEGMLVSPVPQTLVIHDLTMLVRPSAYFSTFLKAYMRFVLPVVMDGSQAVVCVSENTAADVRRLCDIQQDKLHVVTEGFDKTIYYPRTVEERHALLKNFDLNKPYLLYSGTLAEHKNTPFLAEVLRGAVDAGLDIELAMTGRLDAGSFEQTQNRLRELGVDQRLKPLGYVSREQLSALMQDAFAFVFPSFHEGFGLAPLEAMASGARVLSSDRASLPEVVGDGGFLLNPERAQDWVDVLVANRHGEDSLALRQRAVERAQIFNWDDAAAKIARIIKNPS